MHAILNLGKKTIQAIKDKPEYASLLQSEGQVVSYISLPQLVINKKNIQSVITLSNGEEWTIYLSQLIILNQGTLSLSTSQINVLSIHGEKYKLLIDNNGQTIDYALSKKDPSIANVFIQNNKFEVLSSSIFYK